jgi:tetratricopeptide (TPR) repeat protein
LLLRALAALLVFWSAAAAAAPPPPTTPEGVLSFAEALLAAGESYRAATEYLRFLHHFAAHPDAPRAVRGLGESYAQAGRWDDAVSAFQRLPPGPETRRLLGAALYRGGRYQEAARTLLAPEADGGDAVLGTLALLRVGHTQVPPPAREELAQEYESLPRKSPGLAGGLAAVLPGAGHLYTDRPRDAAISFVLNAAFLWGTVEAARREEWALAGILGFFELGWYSGNVVSAVNAAHKWNRREEGRFFRDREEGVVPRWGLALGPGSVGAVATWRW